MRVEIYLREVYGVVRTYPGNETARLLCQLTGRATFSPETLELVRRLGYMVETIEFKPTMKG